MVKLVINGKEVTTEKDEHGARSRPRGGDRHPDPLLP